MKQSLPNISIIRIVAILFSVICMLISEASYAAKYPGPLSGNLRDSILIYKKKISRSHKITMYPDATQKVLFFSVRGEQGKVYQLYLFDIEGILVKQTEIRNKQTTFISDIEKGVYLFDIFCDDDRIGNGQIEVRGGER